jgi:hypothetical protein
MKRREALAAKDENLKAKTLYAWDFLLGVEDVSRQGALRYRRPARISSSLGRLLPSRMPGCSCSALCSPPHQRLAKYELEWVRCQRNNETAH